MSRVGMQRSYARGLLCGCGFPTELGAKVKTMKFLLVHLVAFL